MARDQYTLDMWAAPSVPRVVPKTGPEADGLRHYQLEAYYGIHRVFEKHRRALLVLATGLGKCLGRGAPVLMFDGTVKPVELVTQGDLLMGPDSRPRTVLSTTVGHGPMRRVVPVKGDPWTCNDVHVLTLKHAETGEVIDVPMDEYERQHKTFKHVHKQFSVGVDFVPAPPPQLDPYCIGLWLGDGTKALGTFTVTKPDAEVGKALEAVAAAFPGNSVVRKQYGTRCASWNIVSNKKLGRGGSRLLDEMRHLFPDAPRSIRIPRHYLTGSKETRLELLAGLIDSDGSLVGGCFEFSQRLNGLAADVAFLARSLGFKVTSRLKNVNGADYDRLFILGDIDRIPTRLPRKQAPPRKMNKDALRTGFKVEDIGHGDYFGFTLDGDGRFLLGDFTVTHNTETFASVAKHWPGRVLVLAHRNELVEQAAKRIEKMTGEFVEIEQGPFRSSSARIVVGSIQTVQRQDRLESLARRGGFTLIIIDEFHHYTSRTYRRPADFFVDAKVLGVTATPDRADGKALGAVVDDVAYSMDIVDGIRAGYLVPLKGREVTVEEVNLDAVSVNAGDLAAGELDDVMVKGVEGVVRGMLHHAGDQQGIIFFPGVKSAHLAAARLNAIKPGCAVSLDGETDPDTRKEIVADFKEKRVQFLANCMIATEGFDAPDVAVVGLARPTKSRSLYSQMCGRGTRVLRGVVDHIHGAEGAFDRRAAILASSKPHCLLLDFVGVNTKHSLMTPEDLLGGDMDEDVKKKAKELGKEEAHADKTVGELLDLGRAEIERLARALRSKVKSRSRDFDPFLAYGIDQEAVAKYEVEFGRKPMTERQHAFLSKMGLKPFELDGLSRREASKLQAEVIKRREANLATHNQLRVLAKHGLADVAMSKATASQAMDYLSTHDWGRTADPVELRNIVEGRAATSTGEEW